MICETYITAHINWFQLLFYMQFISWTALYTITRYSSQYTTECGSWVPATALSLFCSSLASPQDSCQSGFAQSHMQHPLYHDQVSFLVGKGGLFHSMEYRLSHEMMTEMYPSSFLKVPTLEALLQTTRTQTLALLALREGCSLSTA